MGKVYEALRRTEDNDDRMEWSTAEDNPSAEVDESSVSEHLDFLHYSLSARSTFDLERLKSEDIAASSLRDAQARPAREVNLDVRRLDPHLVSFYDFDPPASNEYKKLAISVIAGASRKAFKRVLIASAQHGEGRTSVTLNLACALARARQRILVVGSDLHRPSLTRLLGIDSGVGLADALDRGLDPGSAAVRVLPHDFVVLPTRECVDNSAKLLASAAFFQLLQVFDPDYDFMLFDSPPLLAEADARLLVRLTDATLLVIRAGKTSTAGMARAMTALSEESLVGVVMNRVKD